MPLKAIQERLGHKDFTTTFNVYGHLSKEVERETAIKMNEILSDMSKKWIY